MIDIDDGLKVKDFGYWKVFVNPDADYPGGVVILAKKHGPRDFAEMEWLEWDELIHDVLPKTKAIIAIATGASAFEYRSSLLDFGNLHVQVIPIVQDIPAFGKEAKANPWHFHGLLLDACKET